MSFARLLQPLSNVIGLASSLGPKSIVTQTIRFLSSKPTKDTPKRSSFHFADYKAKPSPLAGVGDVYKTQLVRKKVLADPSKPTFDKIECLKWAKWRMLRDVRRRHVFVDYWATRDALENVRKCKILPASVRVSFASMFLFRKYLTIVLFKGSSV